MASNKRDDMRAMLILLVCLVSGSMVYGDAKERAKDGPVDYYVRIAAYSLHESLAVAKLAPNESRAADMRVLALKFFNYFVLSKRGLTAPSAYFERVLREVYKEAVAFDPAFARVCENPLLWDEKSGVVPGVVGVTLTKKDYDKEVDGFLDFVKGEDSKSPEKEEASEH